jgi:hypothetical protein
MGWSMFYLFVALKIPVVAAIYLVYWAIKQEPEPAEDSVRDDGGAAKRPHPVPRLPRSPRRGPHGEAALPSPPRVRPLRARGRHLTR